MRGPELTISLDPVRRAYRPGETLSGEFLVEWLHTEQPTAAEVSVLWYTEGRGDEDLAVHYFDRRGADQGSAVDWRRPQRFSTQLPPSPLSYEGVLVKVRWCVRARVFFPRGKEVFAEQPFRLGSVPPAQAVLPSEE
jgi:hypothetical protein